MTVNCPKIVFSFDFELGWGVLESSLWKQREASSLYVNLRGVIDELVGVLNDTQIPTTWAMVSSLLLNDEKDLNIDFLPDSYKDSVISFYRGSSESTRCGLDIIDKLGVVEHLIEVASHTSTHIYAEQTDVTSDQYVKDVGESISVLEAHFGKKVSSLVFPRDQALFNNDVARDYPLNFRLNPNFGCGLNRFDRIVQGASRLYRMVPRSRVVMGMYGECYQTGSLYFNWSGGSYETLKKLITQVQARRLINNMNQSDIYHIWLHPFNLAESRDHFKLFSKFIFDICDLRDKGLVEVLTMKEIVSEHHRGKLF